MQDNYKSTKDSSNNVSINKIKCINDNININGVNDGNIKAGNNGLATSASSFGNDERYYAEENNNNKQSKGFDCIVNNNNENRQVTLLPNEPIPIPPTSPPTDFLDLAVANAFSDNFSILLEDGDGTFTEAAESPVSVGEGPVSVAVGDFN